ncbi:MAG: hypothetical protein Q4B33_06995 [Fusobacterium sp.]|nr:hypothetical protein [Fusobacterium sp.]
MLKIWGIIVLITVVVAYLIILLLSSTNESDDKYVVGILKIGYKTFDYFKNKKSSIGVYFSYLFLGVGYLLLKGKTLEVKRENKNS